MACFKKLKSAFQRHLMNIFFKNTVIVEFKFIDPYADNLPFVLTQNFLHSIPA